MNKYRLCAAGAMLLFWSGALPAEAVTFTELGDAGQNLITANVVQGAVGAGGTDVISGRISGIVNDADLFSLTLSAGTTFSATVTGIDLDDSQLFLFNAAGFGLTANDDISATNVFSAISFTIATSGTYYLGISGYNYDPQDSTDYIFPDTQFGQVAPVAGAGRLSDWVARTPGPVSFGDYTISLTTTPIPEPSSVLGLMAVAGFGAVAFRRKRTQS